MRKLLAAIALTVISGFAGAQAQTFPSRQITLIVPFPPGGSTDVAARIMAERMRAATSVEPPGGNGTISVI